MFPQGYWPALYFPARYWPKVGSDAALSGFIRSVDHRLHQPGISAAELVPGDPLDTLLTSPSAFATDKDDAT